MPPAGASWSVSRSSISIFPQSVQHRRSTPKERVIGSLGATQLIHPGGSILIREGQFFDTELLGAPDYALKGCTPKARRCGCPDIGAATSRDVAFSGSRT